MLRFQAPKKEQLTSEDSESVSGSESDSDAGSDKEPAQRTPAVQPQVQQAAKAKPVPEETTAAVPVPAVKAAAKAFPKPAPVGSRARLQQSAAASAAAKDAEPQPKALPHAAEVVSPLVQVASQPAPLLAPSVSPRLPHDSADVGALPTRSTPNLPYSSADLTASRDPDAAMQQSVTDYPGDSVGKNGLAGFDEDFFAGTAASATTAAEDSGMSHAPMGPKASKGWCAWMCASSSASWACLSLWLFNNLYKTCMRPCTA